MFILTTISDVVQIVPVDFSKRAVEALEDNLNAKYSNKVIQDTGLAICVYDILKTSDGHIGQDASVVNVNIEFRLIVFRPFKGEVILGKISSSGEWGIKVRLDFFDDIFVPPHLLFEGSVFNVKEQCWVLPSEDSDLYYDKHEWVRIRIEAEEFHDNTPQAPPDRASAEGTQTPVRKSPYSIEASMQQSGLGPSIWWEQGEE